MACGGLSSRRGYYSFGNFIAHRFLNYGIVSRMKIRLRVILIMQLPHISSNHLLPTVLGHMIHCMGTSISVTQEACQKQMLPAYRSGLSLSRKMDDLI